jgi:hypothetical protein
MFLYGVNMIWRTNSVVPCSVFFSVRLGILRLGQASLCIVGNQPMYLF